MIKSIEDLRKLVVDLDKDPATKIEQLKHKLAEVEGYMSHFIREEIIVSLIERDQIDEAQAVADELILADLEPTAETYLHLAFRLYNLGYRGSIADKIIDHGLLLAERDDRGPSARAYWIRQGWSLLVLFKHRRGEDFTLEKEALRTDEEWHTCSNDLVGLALKCRTPRKAQKS